MRVRVAECLCVSRSVCAFVGACAGVNSGGFRLDGRDNPTWCLNPQYWLTANPADGDVNSQITVKVHATAAAAATAISSLWLQSGVCK